MPSTSSSRRLRPLPRRVPSLSKRGTGVEDGGGRERIGPAVYHQAKTRWSLFTTHVQLLLHYPGGQAYTQIMDVGTREGTDVLRVTHYSSKAAWTLKVCTKFGRILTLGETYGKKSWQKISGEHARKIRENREPFKWSINEIRAGYRISEWVPDAATTPVGHISCHDPLCESRRFLTAPTTVVQESKSWMWIRFSTCWDSFDPWTAVSFDSSPLLSPPSLCDRLDGAFCVSNSMAVCLKVHQGTRHQCRYQTRHPSPPSLPSPAPCS